MDSPYPLQEHILYMKKLLFVFPIITLLAVGCNPSQQAYNQPAVTPAPATHKTVQTDISSCLSKGVALDTIVSADFKGANKISVSQKLTSLRASCQHGQLVDKGDKPIKFYNLTGCWGNPPPNYLQIMADQDQAIKNLQTQYTVITITCDSSGIPIP